MDFDALTNGGNSGDNEEMARIESARAKIKEYMGENSQISHLRNAELSLLKSMLTAPKEFEEQQVFLLLDLLDDEEAMDHVNAYYEAKELGMDVGWNIALAFALVSSNRKTQKSNRIAMYLDSFSHYRYTSNVPGDRKVSNDTKRSPLSG